MKVRAIFRPSKKVCLKAAFTVAARRPDKAVAEAQITIETKFPAIWSAAREKSRIKIELQ